MKLNKPNDSVLSICKIYLSSARSVPLIKKQLPHKLVSIKDFGKSNIMCTVIKTLQMKLFKYSSK